MAKVFIAVSFCRRDGHDHSACFGVYIVLRMLAGRGWGVHGCYFAIKHSDIRLANHQCQFSAILRPILYAAGCSAYSELGKVEQ